MSKIREIQQQLKEQGYKKIYGNPKSKVTIETEGREPMIVDALDEFVFFGLAGAIGCVHAGIQSLEFIADVIERVNEYAENFVLMGMEEEG